MVIGALVTCAFFFAYTAVRTHAGNLGFTCAIYFTVNVYYGTSTLPRQKPREGISSLEDVCHCTETLTPHQERFTLTRQKSCHPRTEPLVTALQSPATVSWV